jgi:glycine/D-amino acid oxidase-like deaminating enzyme
MQRGYDVVIVGGGVMGSSAAYWLAAHPGFSGSILIVERDPSYKNATTALSLGSIRQQFSTPENVQMSLFGAQFLAALGDYLAIDGVARMSRIIPAAISSSPAPRACRSSRAIIACRRRLVPRMSS